MKINKIMSGILLCVLLTSAQLVVSSGRSNSAGDVFPTNGVHNNFGCDPAESCIAKRKPGEPSDPVYPQWWISDWTMYRVKSNYKKNPPPYTSPPSTLSSKDYTVSYGTSYYDATFIPVDGDGSGAMMEHYENYCLPIFPIKNNSYSCSFISLGNKAYFLTYKKNRPGGMPACCLFSPLNHPPRKDFIKHLPYDLKRSQQLNGETQAYSLRTGPSDSILFGYAFYKDSAPDAYNMPPYRHPQSFFFSGNEDVAKAPIVSQNYSSFRMEKPEAKYTWERVRKMCPAKPVNCQLF